MTQTCLLEPLDADDESLDRDQVKRHWSNIQDSLKNMGLGKDMTFREFLSSLQITEEEYILAVRSSLKTTTIFLKRTPWEIRVNAYNKHMLLAWRANIDIQYVLDVYACAKYVASYITKAQRGMSELLRKACDDVRAGNHDIRQQLRVIANKFLNAVELSAQEAAYILLQLPMKRSSRQVIFVNTNSPDDRVVLLKPHYIIENMKDDDEDIVASNLITRYQNRPNTMENETLAEYAAWYTDDKKPFRQSKNSKDGYLPEVHDQDNEEDDFLCDGEGSLPNVDDNTTSMADQTTKPNTTPSRRKVCL